MTRTSTVTGLLPPTRSKGWPSSTRRNLAWMPGLISPISSSMRVPLWAASNLPIFRSVAPVKAPRSWPNSSLASNSADSAAQFKQTKTWSRRGLESWTARATSSLPTPLSPRISTVALLAAARPISSATCWMAGLWPIMRLCTPSRSRSCTFSVRTWVRFSANSWRRLRFSRATATVSATARVNSNSSGSGTLAASVEYKWIRPRMRRPRRIGRR